jgi:hypothetical protein
MRQAGSKLILPTRGLLVEAFFVMKGNIPKSTLGWQREVSLNLGLMPGTSAVRYK